MNDMSWVLLRGLARQEKHWGPFLDQLKATSKKVITLDLPGVGHNKHLSCPLELKSYIPLLRDQFLSVHSEETNWSILGISLGGMLSLSWIDQYPDDFKKAVIINASCSELSTLTERFSLKAFYTLFSQILNTDTYERERAILDLTTSMVEVDEDLIQKWVDISLTSPTAKLVVLKQLWAAKNFKLPTKLCCRPLFLASKKDQLAYYKITERIAKKFDAPVAIHPLAGHDLPLDDPYWTLKIVQSHLNNEAY